jgi:N-acetylmuramidase
MAFSLLPGPQDNSDWALRGPYYSGIPPFHSSLPGLVCFRAGGVCQNGLPHQVIISTEPDLDFLFTVCPIPKVGITESDFTAAAATLGVEVNAIKAVSAAETAQSAFDLSGRPTILFERHKFHSFTVGKFSKAHPGISKKSPGGYGLFQAQYGRLQEAYLLNKTAALKAASWGRFQIMGEYHKMAGFPSVEQFVLAMTKSEANHLTAFVSYIINKPKAHKGLKNLQWTTFAQGYNGEKQKGYDAKIKSEYSKLEAASRKKS